MSYCRFSEADVYVFGSVYGGVECCGCFLGASPTFYNADELVAHLRAHVEAGHEVPARLLDVELYDPEDFEHWPRE